MPSSVAFKIEFESERFIENALCRRLAGSQHQFRCNYLTKIGRFQWNAIFVDLRVNRKEAFDNFTGRDFPKRGNLHEKFNKFLRKF